MDTIKNKKENLTRQQPKREQTSGESVDQEKTPVKAEPDTGPDEFIGPNADTDLPLDREVINDAVLRGEPKADDVVYNDVKEDAAKKKGAGKKDAEKK